MTAHSTICRPAIFFSAIHTASFPLRLVAGAILLGIYSFLYPTHDGKESPESRFSKDATVGNETKVATDKSVATDVNAI
jgi:hypothetical protein